MEGSRQIPMEGSRSDPARVVARQPCNCGATRTAMARHAAALDFARRAGGGQAPQGHPFRPAGVSLPAAVLAQARCGCGSPGR